MAEYDPVTGRINVSWRAVGGSAGYVVWWVSGADRFDFGQARTAETFVSLPRNGGFINGEWKIRVRVADGGAWSELAMVTIIGAPPELVLDMQSSRKLCTEGTLTEISWSADGGIGALSLQVNSELVAKLDGTAKVNCGMIPRDEDGEIDESRRDAVITGFLRDGRGVVRSASIRVPRAEALPVPTEVGFAINLSLASLDWSTVAGAGEQSSPNANHRHVAYALRTRPVGRTEWTTEAVKVNPIQEHHVYRIVRSRAQEWEFSVAAVRHNIEIETPSVLNWSISQKFRTVGLPRNLSVDTAHDSIIVRFDRQPYSGGGYIEVAGSDGIISKMYSETGEEGQHEILIGGLKPDEEYDIAVRIFEVAMTVDSDADLSSFVATATARTSPAPQDWTPPATGPQNIRTTATSESITARWDPPQPDGAYEWRVTLRLVSDNDLLVGHRIDGRRIVSGDTEWTTWGSTITRRIRPATTYRIQITQLGVQEYFAETLVTTPALDDLIGEQDSEQPSQSEQSEPDFIPIWPLQIDAGYQIPVADGSGMAIISATAWWLAAFERWGGGGYWRAAAAVIGQTASTMPRR